MQADLHYRHVLLGKTLAAWKVGWNSLFEALFSMFCMCCSVSVRAEELPQFSLEARTHHMCKVEWRLLYEGLYELQHCFLEQKNQGNLVALVNGLSQLVLTIV